MLTSKNENKNKFFIGFSLKSFFRAYRDAVQRKAIFFTYPLFESEKHRSFLICLEKEKRIAGYHFNKEKKTVDIFLSYDFAERKASPLNVTFYSSKGRKRMVSLKFIQLFAKQNPTAFALIHTNYGFMTWKDCLQHNCGGEFLLTIF